LVSMPARLQIDDIVYLQESYEHVFAAPTRHALVVDTTTCGTRRGGASRGSKRTGRKSLPGHTSSPACPRPWDS